MKKNTIEKVIIAVFAVVVVAVAVGVVSLKLKQAGVQVAVESGKDVSSAEEAALVSVVPKKVVYAGNFPDSETGATKSFTDSDGDIHYYKKINIPEIVVPGDGAPNLAQQKMPMVLVYAEDILPNLPDVIDDYSPLSHYDYSLKTGAVWAEYLTKSSDERSINYKAGSYKIIVVSMGSNFHEKSGRKNLPAAYKY